MPPCRRLLLVSAAAAAVLLLAVSCGATTAREQQHEAELRAWQERSRAKDGEECSPGDRAKMNVCGTWLGRFYEAGQKKKGEWRSICKSVYDKGARKDNAAVEVCEEVAKQLTGGKGGVDELSFEAHKVRVYHPLTCQERLKLPPTCMRPPNGGTTCLWAHGARLTEFTDRDALDYLGGRRWFVTSDLYWGTAVKTAIRSCDTNIFLRFDTYSLPWHSKVLQEGYCDALDRFKADVVISHSMGGMILAAGAANAISGCKRMGKEGKDIWWMSLGSPLRGSPMSKAVEKVCGSSWFGKDKNSFASRLKSFKLGSAFKLVISKAATKEQCTKPGKALTGTGDLTTKMFKALQLEYVAKGSHPQLSCGKEQKAESEDCVQLIDEASRRMSAEACGIDQHGALGDWKSKIKHKVHFGWGDNLLGFKWGNGDDEMSDKDGSIHGNDGFVSFHSCAVNGGREFTSKPTSTSKFVALKCDHDTLKGTFEDADGIHVREWMENMVRLANERHGKRILSHITNKQKRKPKKKSWWRRW